MYNRAISIMSNYYLIILSITCYNNVKFVCRLHPTTDIHKHN